METWKGPSRRRKEVVVPQTNMIKLYVKFTITTKTAQLKANKFTVDKFIRYYNN